ncbi:hypothetical protein K1719_039343 [Acacia pycnantha]|nr:hypothetical protein K1719_039343 [Acacia pycnantha]
MEKRNPCIVMVPCPDFAILPQVNRNDIPQSAVHPATHIVMVPVMLSLPSLRHALTSLNSQTRLVAMIADLLSVDALENAKEFNLKSYVYYASGATSVCFFLTFPELDQRHDMVSTGFRAVATFETFRIGAEEDGVWTLDLRYRDSDCIDFHGKDLPDTIQERSSESYGTILHICKRFNFADGIEQLPRTRKRGLETSGHNFLWVVRAPSESSSSAYLSSKGGPI